eukprot:771447-Amphidinium_carterae.1
MDIWDLILLLGRKDDSHSLCRSSFGGTMLVLCQIIFKGETAHVLPEDDPLEQSVSVNALLRFMGFIQARIGDSPWMLLLDHAPIHASQEFKTKEDEQFPHVFFYRERLHKCGPAMRYPRFGPIQVSHPADLDEGLQCHYIDYVIALQTELGELRKLPKLRANFVSLVHVGLRATFSSERRKVAWVCLYCNGSNLQLLDEADELYTAGLLFLSNAGTEEVVAAENGVV